MTAHLQSTATVEDEIYSRILEQREENAEEGNPYLNDHTVNRGDVSVFGLKGTIVDVDKIENAGKALTRLVRPGDVVDRNTPSADYAYFWYALEGSEFAQDEFEELREKGWRRVTKDEFWVRRWQVDSRGSIRNGRNILMCLPAALWAKFDKEKRAYYNRLARMNADDKSAEFQEMLDRNGVAAEMFVESTEKDGVTRRNNKKK